MQQSKKIAIFAVYLVIVCATVFSQWRSKANNSIEFFSALDIQEQATAPTHPIDRFNLPFKFLLMSAEAAPVSLEAKLKHNLNPGAHSLWMLMSQAPDHSVLSLEADGVKLPDIDNRVREGGPFPAQALKYIGDVDLQGEPLNLRITSTSPGQNRHYLELGLFILAPPGTEPDTIQELIPRIGEFYTFDSGALLVILIASFIALAFLSKSISLRFLKAGPEKIGLFPGLVLFVTAAVICFSSFYMQPVISMPISQSVNARYAADQEDRFEKIVNDQVISTADSFKIYQSTILPATIQYDEVPDDQKISEGVVETDIYHIAQPHGYTGMQASALSGDLNTVQTMSFDRLSLIFITLLNIALSCAIISSFVRTRWITGLIGIGAITALSVLLCLRIAEYMPPEFFLNIRHAFILTQHGKFSLNAHQWVDGTSEFLIPIVIALWNMIGNNLVDAGLSVNLASIGFLIFFSYRFVLGLTESNTWALLSALCIALYPPVLWSGATGASPLFVTAFILAASYFLLFSENKKAGLVTLALLPLIRFEALLFVIFMFIHVYILRPLFPALKSRGFSAYLKEVFKNAFIIAVPSLLMILFWFLTFGRFAPLPFLFRYGDFDNQLFSWGIDQFVREIIFHDITLFIIGSLLLGFLHMIGRRISHIRQFQGRAFDLAALNIILFIYALAHFTGGLDWTAEYWNRLAMPFNLVMILTFLSVLYRACFGTMKGQLRVASLIIFFIAFATIHNRAETFHGAHYLKNAVERIKSGSAGSWYISNQSAYTGKFLKAVFPDPVTVAGFQEAALFYSEQEILGFSGLSSADIIAQPLQPIQWWISLPRKRAAMPIRQEQPSILLFDPPSVSVNIPNSQNLRGDIKNLVQQRFFEPSVIDMIYYSAGSPESLKNIGYRHISIAHQDNIFSFFVHTKIYDELASRLTAKGYRHLGKESISYRISPNKSSSFLPDPS